MAVESAPSPLPEPSEFDRFVNWAARKYALPGVAEQEDLAGDGWVGLMTAYRDYDPGRSPDFARYARGAIRMAITKARRAYIWPIRIPIGTAILARKVSDGEIDAASLSANDKERVAMARRILDSHTLKDHLLGDGTLAELVAGPDGDGGEEIGRDVTVMRLLSALRALDARELAVVLGRFGIDGHELRTFREIGAEIGVGHERARTIGTEALAKLGERLGIVAPAPAPVPGQPRATVGDPGRRFSGVYRNRSRKKDQWRAMIFVDGKLRQVGYFATDEEAALAYDREARRLGRPVNFPGPGEEMAVAGRCGGRSGRKVRRG
jgi:RNA polymerase sigma factor (sigma-70 family)